MKKQIILGCIILSLFSNQTNQPKQTKREGLWIEQYSLDSAHYKSVGKYKNDDPIKKWCYYLDGKIIKRKHTEIHVTPNFIIKTENTIEGQQF
jgi:hypothetical protein